jgi:Raf kinase inhibitor-like YbhB/YbcL family protein
MRRLLTLSVLLALILVCPEPRAEGGNPDMAFTIRSTALEAGGPIAQVYTCDGRDVSPPLRWDNVPPGTKSFALVCDDPDAPMGTWVHWVIYGIPESVRQLPEAVPVRDRLSDGALQGRNDFGKIGYGGPCPPRGKPHRYFFRLYALDDVLSLAPGLSKKALLKAIEGHVLAEAELFGTYGRR